MSTPRLTRHADHRHAPLDRWAARFFGHWPVLEPPASVARTITAWMQADADPADMPRMAQVLAEARSILAR